MINYTNLGQKVTTSGGIEKVNLQADIFNRSYGASSKTFTITINLHSGSLDYTVVKKDQAVSTMDTPKYDFDSSNSTSNPPVVPVISICPLTQDLYINSTDGTEFSINV